MKIEIEESSLEKILMDEEKLWKWFKKVLEDYGRKLSTTPYSVRTLEDVTGVIHSGLKDLETLLWGWGGKDSVPFALTAIRNLCGPNYSDDRKKNIEGYVLGVAKDLCRCVAELYCNHKWLAGSTSWKNEEWSKVMKGKHSKVLTSSDLMIPNALDIASLLVQALNKAGSQPSDEENVDDIIKTINKLKIIVRRKKERLDPAYSYACGAAGSMDE